MPPPSTPALFPLTMLLISVNVPALLKMPPPSSPAAFPVTVLLLSVSVPALKMPPPPTTCSAVANRDSANAHRYSGANSQHSAVRAHTLVAVDDGGRAPPPVMVRLSVIPNSLTTVRR